MFDFLGNALKNVISKPATRMYPFEKRAPMKDARGALGEINIETCIFCSICEKKCPSLAIKVDKAAKSWEVDRYKCIVCAVCVEVCPKKCLDMTEEHKTASTVKEQSLHVQPAKAAAPAQS